ncbi:MAG: cell division protein [Parcubacteria group bacterium Gr01-1014_38]|nr:MAG: cell division protein [Parcubacteria group bacterium Gr01-1014_38]
MNFLAFTRALRWGLVHYWRNIWLSLAATGVLLLTLAMLALLLIVTVVGRESLKAIEAKVDVTVFMADTATDEVILAIKADLEGRADITSVQYVTKEQALATFEAHHRANPIIAQALQELGENPLQASLIVKAESPQAYPQIAESLKSPKYQPYIGKVTFEDNREVIVRLSAVLRTLRRIGLILTIAIAAIAVLVTFNTIRLAIYGYHEEIAIMRLVGASPWFIKGPFLIEGLLSGSISALLTLLYFFPFVRILSSRVSAFVAGGQFDLARWSAENALGVSFLFLVSGILLSTVSSWIAVRRYLR